MPRPALWRRRSVWVPTPLGATLALSLVALASWFALRALYPYLAQDAPVGRGILVIEGWVPAEAVADAVERFRRGGYELFVASGGPIADEVCPPGFETYAERAATLARGFGLDPSRIASAPAPASAQDRTYRSALSVREWSEATGRAVEALDVYSYGAHARRTRWLYQLAFGDAVDVGVIAGAPADYAPRAWWRTSEGGRKVVGELLAWTWVRLFFHPGAHGSWEEKWGPRPE